MMDLFTRASAATDRAVAAARFEAIWNTPEARARRRRTSLDLARGLIAEARRCRLAGWPRDAGWWLGQAATARAEASSLLPEGGHL